MLQRTQIQRYGVKLEQLLPSLQPVASMIERTLEDTFWLSDQLVCDCMSAVSSSLEAWRRVKSMQVISTTHLLCRFARAKGLSADRFFDRNCSLVGGKYSDRGHIKKKLKGQNSYSAKSLTSINYHLSDLYVEDDAKQNEWLGARDRFYTRIDIDYGQALWRSLLIEVPLAEVLTKLYWAHKRHAAELFAVERNELLGGNQESLSKCTSIDLTGWEHLASCITLMREYSKRGNSELAQLVAKKIYLSLTLLGIEFQDRGIGSAMLRYCCEHILPIGNIKVEPICIARASALLNTLSLAPCLYEDFAVDWKTRRLLMVGILRNDIDTDLQTICDPAKYVDGFPDPLAWKRMIGRKIEFVQRGYPPGRWILDLENLLVSQPQIETWADPAASRAAISKVRAPRGVWDGLGSRKS